MKTIIIIIAFLFSSQCFSQVECILSFNEENSILELIIKNDSKEKSVNILDYASGNSKITSTLTFSYSITENNYELDTEWWCGIEENLGMITLKPQEKNIMSIINLICIEPAKCSF